MKSISTITCRDLLLYSDELISFSYHGIKKQPIALLYKKALTAADEELELNDERKEDNVVSGMLVLISSTCYIIVIK